MFAGMVFASTSIRFEGGIDVKKPDTDVTVGVVEAAIRILMDDGFTRDESLQLMLSKLPYRSAQKLCVLVLP